VASRRKPRARFTHVDRIEVSLWGQTVGAVALDPAWGYYAFRYTPEFRTTGIELAPLRMPLKEDRTFLFTDLPEATYRRLPALLSDALPDDFGNALVDRYMADQGIPSTDVTALDRLAYLGNRAMGALQFRPTRGAHAKTSTPIELGRLVEQARQAMHGAAQGDDDTYAALRSIIDVGTSAGGARAKAVIAWNPVTQEIRSGQVTPPPGFEHWLLKFDGMGADRELGDSQNYGRIEYAYFLMARAAGIDMMESRLLEERGRAHFMTRRFDRDADERRYHIQTLCAMDHLDFRRKGTNAYAQLFLVIDALNLDYEAREQAFRRMTFNAMARNCDDHTKNFAFRLRQGHAWEIAPAYDVTFAHNPPGDWTNQHLMSVNGKFRDIARADLLAEAERFRIGSARTVIEQVAAALGRWEEFAAEAKLPAPDVQRIGAQHLLSLRKA
jgi:serine/threonine-protein kinase HipA